LERGGDPQHGQGFGSQCLLRAAQHHQLRRAIALLKGKAEQIEHNGKVVHGNVLLPTVIRLRHYWIPLTQPNVFHRDGHRCQYGGCYGEDLTLDPVIPRRQRYLGSG